MNHVEMLNYSLEKRDVHELAKLFDIVHTATDLVLDYVKKVESKYN